MRLTVYLLIHDFPPLIVRVRQIPTLPDQMSYAEVYVRTQQGQVIQVLRREVFDIRAQLMAEDSLGDQGLIEGLSKDDITPGLYEGGFKTWECSIDLASYILSQPQIEDHIQDRPWHIIEVRLVQIAHPCRFRSLLDY